MTFDGFPVIQPNDRVRIQSGTTEYDVIAVSRAGHDVYLRETGSRMAGGTWVDIRSVTLTSRAAA